MKSERTQRISPLTERRKETTRLEISRAALNLFTERGVDHTTAGDIAAAAGVSLRTFWRYFSTKEEALRPLLAHGVDSMLEVVGQRSNEFAALDVSLLTGLDRYAILSADELRAFVRLALVEPGVQAVWTVVHYETEARLRDTLMETAGDDAIYLQVWMTAAFINVSLRIAMEAWAMCESSDLGEIFRFCLERATRGADIGRGAAPGQVRP